MSELEDGKACKDLWDFSVERGNIDTETHPIGVLGAGLRSYVAALEAERDELKAKLEAFQKREVLPAVFDVSVIQPPETGSGSY